MKAIQFVTIILLSAYVFSACSSSSGFEKVPEESVNKQDKTFAQQFANDYLNAAKSGTCYEFTNEGTDTLMKSLTKENQQKAYDYVKNEFGEFQSLEYAETWEQKSEGLTIYRFKGAFDKSEKKLEVRVVLDEAKKIAGFWIKPWRDDTL